MRFIFSFFILFFSVVSTSGASDLHGARWGFPGNELTEEQFKNAIEEGEATCFITCLYMKYDKDGFRVITGRKRGSSFDVDDFVKRVKSRMGK